jgi:dTDP-4-dehydrorhamnose 3,5-epimerase
VSRFTFTPTPLAGLYLVENRILDDHRGFFTRRYCADEFREGAGVGKAIAQINQTLTHRTGTVRGLHFQRPPHAEFKVVSCLRGEIFDVAVDLRPASPTFLRWHGEILSSSNHRSLVIPEGFAHGFQTLAEECELLYLHTAAYHQKAEGALNYADPKLDIAWPLKVTEVSERDRSHPLIGFNYQGIEP